METSNNSNLYAAFFENSEMLLSIYDKNLTLIDVNPAFLKALHFDKEDIIGKNINDFSPDCKSSGRYAQYEEVIRTGKTFVTDQVRLHPSLGSIYLRLTAFKLGDGMAISSKDITDLKETIDDLETFIYRTSHDLRAPVANVLGIINIAQEELNESKQAIRYLELLKTQNDRLDYVLNTLINTTKIRKGGQDFHFIDFDYEIDEILKTLSQVAGFQKIEFKKYINISKKFYSIKGLLITIIQNLLDNAIKYRNTETENPFVTITVSQPKNGIKIEVQDNGIGIPDHLQNEVYKMFFRGTYKASGSGLGLYTTRYCVRKLNGYIQLESKENVGTTFTVFIPDVISHEIKITS